MCVNPVPRGASNPKAKALGWHPSYLTWREGFKKALTP